MSDIVKGTGYKKILYLGIFLFVLLVIAIGVVIVFADNPVLQVYLEKFGRRSINILLIVVATITASLFLLYFYLTRKLLKAEEEAESSGLFFTDGHEISLKNVTSLHQTSGYDAGRKKLQKPLFLVLGDTQPAINIGNDQGARLQGYPFNWNVIEQGIFVSLRNEIEPSKADPDIVTNPESRQLTLWQEYLKWLFHSRAMRPLSGIVLILEVNNLVSSAADDAVKQVCSLLRDNRIKALPIYIVIRNVDSLVGFSDAFSGSEASGADVLGLTFSDTNATTLSKRNEIDTFFTQLNHFILQNFNTQVDKTGLGQYMFVQQLIGMKQRLLTIVETVSAQGSSPRGIYFTEDFQLNESDNLLTNKLSDIYQYQSFRPKSAIRSDAKKKYSIRNTLSKIILSEAGVAGDNPDFLKSRRYKFFFAYAITGLMIAGTVALWYTHYQKNVHELNAFNQLVDSELSEYKATSNDDALPEEYIRTLNFLSPTEKKNTTLEFATFDLSKTEAFNGEKSKYYLDLARGEFVSAIAEEQVSRADNYSQSITVAEQKKAFNALLIVKLLSNPNITDETQKKTFMLQRDELLTSLLKKYWGEKFLDEKNSPQLVGQLLAHLQRGHADGLNLNLVNDERLNIIQARLAHTPLPQRLYSLLKGQAESQYPAPFDLSLELGEGFDQVFRTRPAAAYAFNRFFTREGFMQEYLPREAKIAGLAAIDSWVLGKRATPVAYEGEELLILQTKMRDLYLQDYKRRWLGAIRSIKFLPATNLAETAAQLRVLNDSGMYRNLLGTINENTVFSVTTEQKKIKGTEPEGTESEAAMVAENSEEQQAQANKDQTIQYVTLSLQRQFADFNKLLAKKIDDIEITLSSLSSYMSDLEEQSSVVKYFALAKVVEKFSAKGAADPMNNLSILGRNLPEPLSTQLQQVSHNCWRILLKLAVNDLNQVWGKEVYQYYAENLHGRYPFAKTQREASVASIQAFYGKAGVMDVFFQTYLKPLLESKRTLDGLNVSHLKRIYKHVDYIRQGLFNAAGELNVEFKIEPTTLSRSYQSTVLSIDEGTVKYSHGASLASHIVWPSPNLAAQGASIAFNPLNRNARVEQLTMKGEWGLFRLLDQTQTQSLGDRMREVSFSANLGVAYYLITVPSSISPLTKDLFSGFNLPSTLVSQRF